MRKNLLFFILACLTAISSYAQAPTIGFFSPVSGSVGTLVTIGGTNLTHPTAFTIGGVPATIVSDNGTYLVGMVMPGSVSGTVSVTTAGGTAIAAASFTVTPTSYPATQQGAKIVGTGISGRFSDQGGAVAISADGTTAIVGGVGDNSNTGAAWIFTRYAGTWTQQSKIYPSYLDLSPLGNTDFGTSVAISADGNTAIIGGPGLAGSDTGAAWIFTRNSFGVWSQQGSKLLGTGCVGPSSQGMSVSLSADGNTAVVGGPYDNNDTGAVWIFTRTNGIWAQHGSKLVAIVPIDSANLYQGSSVAISADAGTIIVNGFFIDHRVDTTWIQQDSVLKNSEGLYGGIGAISADGNTVIVGNPSDNGSIGALWVYTRSGNTWAQQGPKLVGSGYDNTAGVVYQGYSVSLSADGNTLIMGGEDDADFNGAAWVFTRTDTTWTQQGAKLVGTNGTFSPQEGYSVAISADGNIGLIGGVQDGQGIGATWVFTSSNCCAAPAYSIAGNTHNDTAATCLSDSLSPGSGLENIKVVLMQYGQVVAQCYTSPSGGYFFPINSSQGYNVLIDTSYLPLSLVCPDSGSYYVSLPPSDTVAAGIDFGLHCPGIDYGISVMNSSSFVPGDTTPVSVIAGNPLLYWYHADCGTGEPGAVMTIINGPVQYIGPAPGALAPASVSGDTLVYNISNLDSLTLGSLYILVSTDTSASIGSPVCITGIIVPSVPDIYPADDTFTVCFLVLSSYDPNHKSVSPQDVIAPGQWLTYNIHFQNTGTDTAHTVVVRDTLSNNVDESTFQYIASSSKAIVQLFGKSCVFTFPNINLPDTAQSTRSQGWIQYKVKTLSNLANNSVVSNTASIYFDYNPAVVTNTTTNLVEYPAGIKTVYGTSSIHLYPNPNRGSFTLQTSASIGSTYTISDMLGHIITQRSIHSDTEAIDLPAAADGVYTLTVAGSPPVRFVVLR